MDAAIRFLGRFNWEIVLTPTSPPRNVRVHSFGAILAILIPV